MRRITVQGIRPTGPGRAADPNVGTAAHLRIGLLIYPTL
jgi:hypothetical protein